MLVQVVFALVLAASWASEDVCTEECASKHALPSYSTEDVSSSRPSSASCTVALPPLRTWRPPGQLKNQCGMSILNHSIAEPSGPSDADVLDVELNPDLHLVVYVAAPTSPNDQDGYDRFLRSLAVQGIPHVSLQSGACIMNENVMGCYDASSEHERHRADTGHWSTRVRQKCPGNVHWQAVCVFCPAFNYWLTFTAARRRLLRTISES